MRLLWASNAPWAPSGYGSQTSQVIKRLAADGHEVAIATNFGLQARIMTDDEWPGVPILPYRYDGVGNDILPAHYHAWASKGPTILITLYDTWLYQAERFADIPTIASWTPVDHYPVTTSVLAWAKQPNVRTIAMSRYGADRFADSGVDATYIPHAIETSIFVPGPQAAAREALGWPADDFIVLINAANKGQTPIRKAWPEMLLAMSMLMKRHPDVRLHLHTERIGALSPDLQIIIDTWGMDNERIAWSPQYQLAMGQIGPNDLAVMYNAADVVLLSSKGEGFGLPVVEAMACGTPAIVSDFSAQPEIVGDTGWLVKVQPDYDAVQGSVFATPIIGSIVECLLDAYREKGTHAATNRAQRAIAKAQEYDADTVFAEHWRPYLALLEP